MDAGESEGTAEDPMKQRDVRGGDVGGGDLIPTNFLGIAKRIHGISEQFCGELWTFFVA